MNNLEKKEKKTHILLNSRGAIGWETIGDWGLPETRFPGYHLSPCHMSFRFANHESHELSRTVYPTGNCFYERSQTVSYTTQFLHQLFLHTYVCIPDLSRTRSWRSVWYDRSPRDQRTKSSRQIPTLTLNKPDEWKLQKKILKITRDLQYFTKLRELEPFCYGWNKIVMKNFQRGRSFSFRTTWIS